MEKLKLEEDKLPSPSIIENYYKFNCYQQQLHNVDDVNQTIIERCHQNYNHYHHHHEPIQTQTHQRSQQIIDLRSTEKLTWTMINVINSLLFRFNDFRLRNERCPTALAANILQLKMNFIDNLRLSAMDYTLPFDFITSTIVKCSSHIGDDVDTVDGDDDDTRTATTANDVIIKKNRIHRLNDGTDTNHSNRRRRGRLRWPTTTMSKINDFIDDEDVTSVTDTETATDAETNFIAMAKMGLMKLLQLLLLLPLSLTMLPAMLAETTVIVLKWSTRIYIFRDIFNYVQISLFKKRRKQLQWHWRQTMPKVENERQMGYVQTHGDPDDNQHFCEINNNKNNTNRSYNQTLPNFVHKMRPSSQSANNNKHLWLCCLFVAATILPYNLTSGASPLQSKHNVAGGGGGGGVHQSGSPSAGQQPPPAVSYPSSSSGEDPEFSYPSSRSEEQFDGADDRNKLLINSTTIQPVIVVEKTPLFPPDLFTREQLENGAVICHIIGVIYMFVALAIVCDEFFVPSLDVIIEKLGITDDVAGATFMAAGGSAPELFTSIIGVFVSFDDVGIGTIVGSAVFNILFVIGMCALFSKTILTLTWWPLFRDCSFYSVSLLVLIYFFSDNLIYWWEALILFTIYISYVGFMKWNQQVERCVKSVISKNKVTRVRSTDQLMPAGNAANSSETSMATQPGGSVTSRASESRGAAGSNSGATGNSSGGTAGSTQTGAKFRHGLLQLMIHTIDPLHDDDVPGKVDDKATQLHAIASLKVLLDATKPQRGGATTSAANHVKINLKETTLADRPNGNIDTTLDSPQLSDRRASWIEQRVKIQTRRFSTKGNEPVEDDPEPLNMAWPSGARKRLTYVLVAPLLVPMWLTLPDTRTPRGKRFFAVTFIGSILWIAAFSYLMVWWANVAGDTARIPPEVMGLTFLAAGTSIPDLITSVIVARKGFGDMAVSSSVGSNIFDVTVGLPIPWLIYGLIYNAPVEVNSVGMVCSITILFMMLLFVVMSIACFRWKMNKGLGLTMFLLYFAFVAVSLMFEYDIIFCPF